MVHPQAWQWFTRRPGSGSPVGLPWTPDICQDAACVSQPGQRWELWCRWEGHKTATDEMMSMMVKFTVNYNAAYVLIGFILNARPTTYGPCAVYHVPCTVYRVSWQRVPCLHTHTKLCRLNSTGLGNIRSVFNCVYSAVCIQLCQLGVVCIRYWTASTASTLLNASSVCTSKFNPRAIFINSNFNPGSCLRLILPPPGLVPCPNPP